MHIINKYNVPVLILILIAAFSASLFASNKIKEDDTLAVIGKKIITASDFINSYKEKIRQTGITDNIEIRRRYLDNLVSDELLIAEAKRRGYDKTETGQLEYQRIRLQELLNSYTLKHISPNVTVTDDDLRELFIKLNTKIKVSHLYAPDKETADSIYSQLQNGKSFKELAKEIFKDPQLRNSGGSLGYISVDEMDPAFEKKAFSMHIGEISEPVKTVQGYSIIKVEDIKQNPLYTENEFLKAYDKLKAFARKRAFEEASKQYAKSLSEELQISFNDEMIDEIYSFVQDNSIKLLNEKPQTVSPEDMNKIVLTSAIGKWTLKNLIDEMNLVTDRMKSLIHTKENLKDFISGLVNREYISQKAVEENLDNTPEFRENVEFTFDTYLLTTFEDELKSRIVISPDSIKNYYEKNKKLFTSEREIRLSSILVDDETTANSIEQRLNTGERFEDLAEKFSIQTVTAENGGDMGFFKKQELGEIADDLFALRKGEWAGPFNKYGKYAFLKCTDYKEPVTKSLEESSEEIEKTLTSFQWYDLRDKYVDSLKSDINLKLYSNKLNELIL